MRLVASIVRVCMEDEPTSTVLREPNIEISGWISTISLDHALRISRSCASYQDGASALRLEAPGVFIVIGGSTGTDFSGSGLMPKWISNSAEGIHGRSRDERFMAPCENVLE